MGKEINMDSHLGLERGQETDLVDDLSLGCLAIRSDGYHVKAMTTTGVLLKMRKRRSTMIGNTSRGKSLTAELSATIWATPCKRALTSLKRDHMHSRSHPERLSYRMHQAHPRRM